MMGEFEKALMVEVSKIDDCCGTSDMHLACEKIGRWGKEWQYNNDWEKKAISKQYLKIGDYAREVIPDSKIKIGESYIDNLIEHHKELMKKVDKWEAALEYYANKENWGIKSDIDRDCINNEDLTPGLIDDIGGKTAREALEKP